MRAAVLSAALIVGLLQACVGDAERQPVPATAPACVAAGGTWGPQGMAGIPQCVMPYADAYQPCDDGDDCEGNCIWSYDHCVGERCPVYPPTPEQGGLCEPNSNGFGCRAVIEDGVPGPGICVD